MPRRFRLSSTLFVMPVLLLPAASAFGAIGQPGRSVARLWDEQLLAAIRIDIPKPPAHARNLFHLSVAMWDAWAAYSPTAVGYLVTEKHSAADVEAARAEAISHAAYRLLKYRFPVGYLDIDFKPCHPNDAISQAAFDAQMDALGYDRTITTTEGDSPAALGNRIAAAVIAYGQTDGSNEGVGLCYPDDTGYAPINPELIFKLPGVGPLVDPNHWQPLAFDFFVTQNGIPIGQSIQRFVGAGWGDVKPFALGPEDVDAGTGLHLDPGPQPRLDGAGDAVVKDAMVELIRLSSRIDTTQGVLVDVSPGAMFNNPLGSDDGAGYPINPATDAPYAPDVVNRADYQRVVTEFWADGPRSETPPGHWNVIANSISDNPLMSRQKRPGGRGRAVNELEWDVKVYLALNGAVHDAAIWAWGNKNVYDSSRPITLIRYMAGLGQSSDPSLPSYSPDGLPLEPRRFRGPDRHPHLARRPPRSGDPGERGRLEARGAVDAVHAEELRDPALPGLHLGAQHVQPVGRRSAGGDHRHAVLPRRARELRRASERLPGHRARPRRNGRAAVGDLLRRGRSSGDLPAVRRHPSLLR
ncbi:MAG: hypothetical protein AUI47_01885 [Acidobacteria bacterium 13_1_40CM_2_68_5]|nr:MAG: hypothetical protein AUI47_01885 [Acidobacteria bacterium 13_1_40CM_2_68_5]